MQRPIVFMTFSAVALRPALLSNQRQSVQQRAPRFEVAVGHTGECLLWQLGVSCPFTPRKLANTLKLKKANSRKRPRNSITQQSSLAYILAKEIQLKICLLANIYWYVDDCVMSFEWINEYIRIKKTSRAICQMSTEGHFKSSRTRCPLTLPQGH